MSPDLKLLADLLVQVAVREFVDCGDTQKKAGMAVPADSLTTNIRSIGDGKHCTARPAARLLPQVGVSTTSEV